MNKKGSISLAVLLAAALLLILALPATARASRTDVASFEYDCANEFESDWMEGQVYHIRGFVHTNRSVSANPELNGINITFADADINLARGSAAIRGTMSLQPDTIDGAWEGSWTFIGNAGVYRGYAVAHGSGELFGKTLFLNLYDGSPTPEDEAMCSGLGAWEGNTIAEGYILDGGS